jgi:hypothetical protein
MVRYRLKQSQEATMARVFVSYSRENEDEAKRLEVLLKQRDIQVWRDKKSIYAGEAWPKAIGKGIAESDLFLLLWSRDAAQSHFVDFEWNTAIALKKTVLPLLLDRTDLPPSLSAINAVSLVDYNEAVSRVLESLSGTTPQGDKKLRESVVDRLGTIKATDAHEVAGAAKAIFQQQGWTIQGNVYQASGNLTVNIGGVEKAEEKKWWSKPKAVVGALIMVITLVGLLLDFPAKIEKSWESLGPQKVDSTPLRGIVRHKDTHPVAGAVVKVAELPEDSVVTTADGGFYFKGIPGKPGDRVRVYVRVKGQEVHDEYVTLPGPVQILLEE